MSYSNPDGIAFADPNDQYRRWNLHDPAQCERLCAALCDADPAFQRVIELRGPSGSGKGYLLRAAAHAAAARGHRWTCARMDLDAASPDGVIAGDYLDHLVAKLRQRPGDGAERAAALRSLVEEARINLQLPLSGWDRLAWLPLTLQLPLARVGALFRRHWPPQLRRPEPERFIETLRELIAWVGERDAAGLLLQLTEQHQPDVSLRVLLRWLPSLPGLCLAFTQGDHNPRPAYADLAPLALELTATGACATRSPPPRRSRPGSARCCSRRWRSAWTDSPSAPPPAPPP